MTRTVPNSPFDAAAFRAAMREVPTTVVLVTGLSGGEPVGMIIGTFTSVSLSPTLVGFFGDLRSGTLEPLLRSDYLTFNLLEEGDKSTTDAFRKPRAERFVDLRWQPSAFGTPVIPTATMAVHGKLHSVAPAGDHCLVLAEVLQIDTSLNAGATSPRPRPLVFYQGRMTRLDPGHIVDEDFWQLGWDAE